MAATNHYFLKGDISGIQDFIFNVKSEKAARVLKARSVFVEALSRYAKQFVMAEISPIKTAQEFDGGGGFYLFFEDRRSLSVLHDQLKALELKLNAPLRKQGIYLVFSLVEEDTSFAVSWLRLAQASQKDKLRKYLGNVQDFKTFGEKEDASFEEMIDVVADKRAREKQFSTIANWANQKIGKQISLSEVAAQVIVLGRWTDDLYAAYEEEIHNEALKREAAGREDSRIPKGSIIDYHFLGYFAKERTGTNKIGILKMDVDNLGALFNAMPNKEVAYQVSAALSRFFQERIAVLLKMPIHFNYHDPLEQKRKKLVDRIAYPSTFKDNIYTIFSGGDDCIFVGAWDTIMEFAASVQQAFKEDVAKQIEDLLAKHDVVSGDKLKLPPTLSAGIELVEPTYPVVQFAALADETLDESKQFKYAMERGLRNHKLIPASKNKITVFGQTLSWDEYKKTHELAVDILKMHLDEGSISKAVLERMRQTEPLFRKQYEQALEGQLQISHVSKLFYFIRNIHDTKALKELSNEMVKPYAQELIGAFTKNAQTNPMKYPVAARWAELLTRNSSVVRRKKEVTMV